MACFSYIIEHLLFLIMGQAEFKNIPEAGKNPCGKYFVMVSRHQINSAYTITLNFMVPPYSGVGWRTWQAPHSNKTEKNHREAGQFCNH
jgi:hypothetical protein